MYDTNRGNSFSIYGKWSYDSYCLTWIKHESLVNFCRLSARREFCALCVFPR